MSRVLGTKGSSRWNCVCDCGRAKSYDSANLRRGKTKSCGCYRGEANARRVQKRKEHPDPQHATLLEQHAGHAYSGTARALGWLDFDSWKAIVLLPCRYCGDRDTRGLRHARRHADSRYEIAMNGVDRVDSSLGYTVENCVSCCRRCNIAKSTLGSAEFARWIRQVYETFARLG